MAEKPSAVRVLVGPRSAGGSIDPAATIRDALLALTRLVEGRVDSGSDIASIKKKYAADSRVYYTLAAVSRRRVLDDTLRRDALKLLYPLRSALEQKIIADLSQIYSSELLTASTGPSFFGCSAKQGVSVRYPLSSCVPTQSCGGRCYAHDGRDRELQLVFRGALNFSLGRLFESSGSICRKELIGRLGRAIDLAVKKALVEQEAAAAQGYIRQPRIRFSHIGEMVATPEFTNTLARELRMRDKNLACILYTRHPQASLIDPDLITVNFTVEGACDPRIKHAPKHARLVSSAWDGNVMPQADVNFLEHHVEKHAVASAAGSVCPVTSSAGRITSCDAAKCDKCFRPSGRASS